MRYKFLTIFAIAFLLGCTSTKNVAKTEDVKVETTEEEGLPELTIQSDKYIAEDEVREVPVYRASETRINDLLHTKLEVSFDWQKQYLNGKATLTFKPYFYPTNVLTLDAKGFDLHKVQLVTNTGNKDLTYEYDGKQIVINLDKTYSRTEKYTVWVDYTAKPNELEAGGSAAITSDKGLYFINPLGEDKNKMPQIWTQGETEASSCWFPTIDSPNEKTTEEIYITVQDKYKTLSNGTLVSSKKNNDGTRTDYWKQDEMHAPYLFMMGVGEFVVVKDSWKRSDGTEMVVDYWVEPEWEKYAKDIFGKTPKMIGYFSDLMGVEYPWDKYSQIVVRDYVSGAMENTTAVIHGDFLYRTDRELLDADNESIIAHELFHHWFGDLVTCESWSNLPMNESFANYSQFLWDEYEHGDMEADKNAYGEMEGYRLSATQSGYHDLIWFDYDEREQMFDGHSYNKGGRILHMLRKYIGDEAFFLSLKDYLDKRRFNTGEVHDLRLSFEKITGEDMNWFFNQWFFDKGHPEIEITQDYKAGKEELVVTIKQTQNFDEFPLFKLPIDIDIYTAEGKKRERVWMTKSEQDFTFNTKEPLLVNVDGDKILLCEKKDEKPEAQWIYQLLNGPEYLDKKEAMAELKNSKNEEAQKAILAMLDHEFYGVKELALKNLYRVSKNENLTSELKDKLVNLTSDKDAGVRKYALRMLKKYYEEDEATAKAMEAGVNDKSYQVMGEALKTMAKDNPKRAMEIAKGLEKEENSSVNNVIADIYSKEGGAEQHDFFVNAIKSSSGIAKFGMLANYKRYMKNQDDSQIEKSLGVYEDVIKNGGMWWIKMQGYQALFATQETIQNRIKEIETEMANTEDSMKKAQLEKDLMTLKSTRNKVEDKISECKKEETDEKVLEYLNM